jgi:hypothetical protein
MLKNSLISEANWDTIKAQKRLYFAIYKMRPVSRAIAPRLRKVNKKKVSKAIHWGGRPGGPPKAPGGGRAAPMPGGGTLKFGGGAPRGNIPGGGTPPGAAPNPGGGTPGGAPLGPGNPGTGRKQTIRSPVGLKLV